jgi:hypothetical protein
MLLSLTLAFNFKGRRVQGQFSPFRDSREPLSKDEATQATNRAANEARKKKKDAEKAKKEVRERTKLQRRKRQQGSDEEAMEDDDDDYDADEEEDEWDNIPWDELAHNDDAGTSLQPSALALGPFGPTPAPT